MQILQLELFTNQIKRQQNFYTRILGFSIDQEDECSFSVQIGKSNLKFTASSEQHIYHYCFLIPSNKLLEAQKWFAQRLNLIKIKDSQFIQRFDSWNAESFYFFDGNGNIVECIVRYGLKNETKEAFSKETLLSINEIGMPTQNIESLNRRISKSLGTNFWKGDYERFGTNGDQDGLFLLPNYHVKKTWFPTQLPLRPEKFYATIQCSNKHYLMSYDNEVFRVKKSKDLKLN